MREIIVFDPFMGVGSVGVAAIELGRRFIGIEIDELYFKAAYNRINDMDNKINIEIVLINSLFQQFIKHFIFLMRFLLMIRNITHTINISLNTYFILILI